MIYGINSARVDTTPGKHRREVRGVVGDVGMYFNGTIAKEH